ncbi:MAG: STAS-like domain-containing protein [Elusimicrobiaceae bacterium]|jgi:hypothetical protein
MKQINIFDRAGSFAENKDVAKEIRLQEIVPALSKGEPIVIDFTGVDAATQSFIHAMISDVIRQFGNEILDKITFKSCNETVKKIIAIVADYMQEGLADQ